MSLAAILEALSAVGATNEMLVAAARAHEATQAADEEARLAKKRASNAERQRRFRAAHPVVSNESNALHPVTERDERDARDTAPPSSVPLSSPPTPPPIIPLPPSPSTSLRSDPSAKAALEFFTRFWAIYPRKTERKAAAAKFFALLKSGTDPEAIIAGAGRYAASNPEPKFTKHPTTWLNRGCWDDEQLPRDGPPKPQQGDFMASVLSGKWRKDLDEQHSSEHQSDPRTGRTEPAWGRPDRDVSEPGGDDSGGPLLDLRVAGTHWS